MADDRNDETLRGKIVVLLGGSGFVGRHMAQELLARGARLRVASRHPERAYALKPLGNLGQVQFARCDVTQPETVRNVLSGADAVVNLVGSFTGDLDDVQGRGAGAIAALARDAGVQSYVHVSALGADAESRSDYARSKGVGEAAVLAAFPTATILRPSILFGSDDNFINMFARLIASSPVLPVFGPQAKIQPLLVDDAASAIANALGNPAAFGGKTFEIAGPEVMTMLELHQRIAEGQGRQRLFAELPDGVSGVLSALPGIPISRDQWAMLKEGNVPSGTLPGLAELGVTPRPLGLYLDRWLVHYRKHGRFGTKASA